MEEGAERRTGASPSPLRLCGELAAVLMLAIAGSLLGAASGALVLAPILGMAVPLAAATAFLRRQGLGWRDLGFWQPMPPGRFVAFTLGTFVTVIVVTSFIITPLLRALGAPPMDASLLANAIEDDTTSYLLFLIPVAWGSAAFGEELLLRGFVLHRFSALAGTGTGVVLQAVLFALGHAYQGVTGMANLFVVGLIFGIAYLRAGRNLWPVIAAHGLIDTVSLTLLYLGFAQPAAVEG